MHRSALRKGSPLEQLVDETESWKKEWGALRDGAFDKFWHRKSKKIVLTVLALKHEEDLVFVRACNLEVSMPAGSLCAERNAFGSALAMYPASSREVSFSSTPACVSLRTFYTRQNESS